MLHKEWQMKLLLLSAWKIIKTQPYEWLEKRCYFKSDNHFNSGTATDINYILTSKNEKNTSDDVNVVYRTWRSVGRRIWSLSIKHNITLDCHVNKPLTAKTNEGHVFPVDNTLSLLEPIPNIINKDPSVYTAIEMSDLHWCEKHTDTEVRQIALVYNILNRAIALDLYKHHRTE